ncbi:prepilin peptidase [Frankia sp. AgB1.9]|uniref:prepilin peptidase n=1 Tax=unclassified Frankia TaxID=2632575 RepID=UPI00193363BA|nr:MULTISPECIES: A24 family peptidase [unclassified Frankia]MBL7491315.1 prepilin peptidase [Frankia sp. AgW1.1]MBL7549077.1 prepilin peptidase [Frankia sp. AgB1.9]MBL7624278.1 prepilin peptidase [Frankia sp. AgB1.8]
MRLAVAALLAAAAVALTAVYGPRLVGAFEPYAGEPVRRKVPSRLTLGIMETAAVAGVTVAVTSWGDIRLLPAYLYLSVIGVVLAAVDLRVHRLPDAIVLPSYLILAALFALAAVADRITYGYWGCPLGRTSHLALRAAVGAAIPLIFFGLLHLMPRSGLGLGDVKVAGLLGAALGWVNLVLVPVGLMIGVLTAGLWAAILLVTRRARRTDPIPYGPHLLLGAFLALLIS